MRLRRVLAAACLGLALLPLPALADASARDPDWQQLTQTQQQALAPLQQQWPQFSQSRKRKWLEIAARYPTMTPAEQATLQRRMAGWAKMSPQQRRQARQNFLAARKSAAERKQAWDRYQSLPPEQRDALAAAARTPPKKPLPVHSFSLKHKPGASAPAAASAPGPGKQPPRS